MSDALKPLFNTLSEMSVFSDLIAGLGDDDRLDSVTVLERVLPIFKAYEQATRARFNSFPAGGKKSGETTDYYTFCTGLAPRGTFAYRIVRIAQPQQHLEILDLDRLLDNTELFHARSLERRAAQLQSMARNVEPRLKLTLENGFKRLKRKLENNARYVQEIGFLNNTDLFFQNFGGAHDAIVKEMMGAIEDLIGDNRHKAAYVRDLLLSGLQAFEEKRADATRELLSEARHHLSSDALAILARNPSSLTKSHYQWLIHDDKKDAEVLEFRRDLASACPIILLTANYQADVCNKENGDFSVPSAIAAMFRSWAMDDDHGVGFYSSLSEEVLGAENASWLMETADHVKAWRKADLALESRSDWDKLSNIVVASREYAHVLGRKGTDVFEEIAPLADEDPRLVSTNQAERAQQLHDMAVLRDRIAVFGVAPKLIHEAHKRGFVLPVTDALFMAGGRKLAGRNVAHIPRKVLNVVAKFNHDDHRSSINLVGTVLFGTEVTEMRDHAFSYGTHHQQEEFLDYIINNRLVESGKANAWVPLPSIQMLDDDYIMLPQSSIADLLKFDKINRTTTWEHATAAIMDGTHFVAMRRNGGHMDAMVLFQEPKDDSERWTIKELIETNSGRQRNSLPQIAQAYLDSPEFQDQVDLGQIRRARKDLHDRLIASATDDELMGVSNLHDVEERAAKLRVLARHWPCPWPLEIDDTGCMKAQFFDWTVKLLLDAVEPCYNKNARVASRIRPQP